MSKGAVSTPGLVGRTLFKADHEELRNFDKASLAHVPSTILAFDLLICGGKHLSASITVAYVFSGLQRGRTNQAVSDPVRKCKVGHRCQDQQNRHRDKHGDCEALCSPDKVSDLVVVSPRYKIKDRRNFRRTVVVVCGSGGCAFTHGSLDKSHY
jgi:hypothetical protein